MYHHFDGANVSDETEHFNGYSKMVQTGMLCSTMGNHERNTYVCNAITDTLLDLLKTKRLDRINIREITEKAQVSRNSFYRNYTSKEDIIRHRIRMYLQEQQLIILQKNQKPSR